MGAMPEQAVLRRLYPPPAALGDRGIGVQRVKHFRHLLILIDRAGRTAELNALRLTRTDHAQGNDLCPGGLQRGVPQNSPEGGRVEEIANHAAGSLSAARWRCHPSKSHPSASVAKCSSAATRRCRAANSRKARLTVSFLVFAPESRMASLRASSSMSICVSATTSLHQRWMMYISNVHHQRRIAQKGDVSAA